MTSQIHDLTVICQLHVLHKSVSSTMTLWQKVLCAEPWQSAHQHEAGLEATCEALDQTVKGVRAWRTYQQKCSKKCFQCICWNLQQFTQQRRKFQHQPLGISLWGASGKLRSKIHENLKEFWHTHLQGHHNPHCMVQGFRERQSHQILQKEGGPQKLSWQKRLGQSCQPLTIFQKGSTWSRAEFSWIHGQNSCWSMFQMQLQLFFPWSTNKSPPCDPLAVDPSSQ